MRGSDVFDADGVRWRFWPPLNPEPDCPRCGGGGYSRTLIEDDDGKIIVDQVGRCHCNVERLNHR
jgi:hypothetical protein